MGPWDNQNVWLNAYECHGTKWGSLFIGGFKYCFGVEPFGVAELTLQRRIGFYVPLDLPLF